MVAPEIEQKLSRIRGDMALRNRTLSLGKNQGRASQYRKSKDNQQSKNTQPPLADPQRDSSAWQHSAFIETILSDFVQQSRPGNAQQVRGLPLVARGMPKHQCQVAALGVFQ